MQKLGEVARTIGLTIGLCIVIGGVGYGAGLAVALLLTSYYGWMLFSFLHYRHMRRGEVADVLTNAARMNQSLPNALWAYLLDRPQGAVRETMVAGFLSAVVPGYYFWHIKRSFDQKVRRLAILLENGMPLAPALRRVPVVASKETVLAAAIGTATGKLADALDTAPRWRIGTVWLEVLPRFIYPVLVLVFGTGIVTFLMIAIIPKFTQIFLNFGIELPPVTTAMIGAGRFATKYWLVPNALVTGYVLLLLLLHSTTTRWYFPVMGHYYRMYIQSRTLKMLGLLLQTGHTVPQAVGILLESGYFQGLPLRRLQAAQRSIQQGNEFAGELQRQGLMPASMVPLVQSAEKAQNLPWALAELGEHQAQRTVLGIQRFTLLSFPFALMTVALLMAFVIYAMFVPLVTLIDQVEPGITFGTPRKR